MVYAVVDEKAPANYAAHVPDLPGCEATGATRAEVARNIRQAIAFHPEGLRLDNEPIPEPQAWTEVADVEGQGTGD